MLALVAGQGDLPTRVAARCDRWPLVAALDGFAPDELLPEITFRLETLGTLLQTLAKAGVSEVCFAGAIHRPTLNPDLIDQATAPLVPKILEALRDGDGGALAIIIRVFEAAGFKVRSASEFVPDFLLPAGDATKLAVSDQNLKDIERAKAVLSALSPLDVGQACVASAGQIIAVESVAGTDWMLSSLTRRSERVPTGGMLVKAPKIGQDLRVDMPTIGIETVEAAAAARLRGIAFAAGQVMVLDPELTIERANQLGLILHGTGPLS